MPAHRACVVDSDSHFPSSICFVHSSFPSRSVAAVSGALASSCSTFLGVRRVLPTAKYMAKPKADRASTMTRLESPLDLDAGRATACRAAALAACRAFAMCDARRGEIEERCPVLLYFAKFDFKME